MNQTFKKLMQKSFFRELTSEAKLIFSRKAKTQAIFNQLSRREFDGASFVDSTICLSLKPSEEDLRQSFETLKVEVYNFFDVLSAHFPGLHEISQEDSIASFFDEPKLAITFEEYPISIEISFCGGFGDVNYLEQKDFKYNSDFFFAV